MKESNLTFTEGLLGINAKIAAEKGNFQKAFDWDKAAQIIKEKFKEHSDLIAEAGLQGDWECTGGIIFENGKPTNEYYTFLSSNWATPTLIFSYDGMDIEEIECFVEENERFKAKSKWDKDSLTILGIEF
jgi:hypothetical protein